MPLTTDQPRRRRNLVIISVLLLLLAIASAIAFELRVPRLPLASNIVVFALFNLNLLVFLLLLVLLLRNLIKLWFERRQKLIGARFKSKLVLAFLSLSLAPAILIFVIASNFINRSIEGWFKPQVERPLDQAMEVAQTYYHYIETASFRHARQVAKVVERDDLLSEDRRDALAAFVTDQQEQLGATAVTVVKTPVKGTYIGLFLLMTLIIVFSFTWFGFYLARGITDPVEQLAEGTREVAAGNLSYKVQARADDEIGVLVSSFNRMTDDLSESKRRLEEAYLDLQDKHTELEDRRRYMETVLEAITTGVVSLDPQNRITTVNRAAATMFGLNEHTMVGRSIDQAFVGPDLRDVVALAQRIQRGRAATVEQALQLRRNGARVSLLASGTTLRGTEGEYAGMVIVFDDLTELLKAQRLAAWREVAQRIAHEIKNPLTPIQLSAQRLRRRLVRAPGDEQQLVTECTQTIIQEVDGLKRLRGEFPRFARMPAPAPRPTDVRPIVEAVALLYRESHPRLVINTRAPGDLPLLDVDPDQFRRVIMNLVDNAVEAVGGAGHVDVELTHAEGAGRVRIVVSDTGPGISSDDKDKLFQPYFSTKAGGMGLGLPIVHEIVTEHGGLIHVEDNVPRGCRFVVDLPVSRSAATVGA